MADDADLDAIRAWVASGGQMGVDREGNPVVPESVITPQPTQPTPSTPAAPAAPSPAAPETPGERSADQAQANRAARREEQRRQPRKQPAKNGPLKGLMNWAANVPTPGGNLALVLILLFFAFAIIPVNSGQTRLQLIWDVLTGNADLPGAGAASGPTASGVASTIGTGAQSVVSGVGGVFSTIGTGAQGVLSGIGGSGIGGSGGGPGGPNAAGYIPPQQRSGAGLLEPPRG